MTNVDIQLVPANKAIDLQNQVSIGTGTLQDGNQVQLVVNKKDFEKAIYDNDNYSNEEVFYLNSTTDLSSLKNYEFNLYEFQQIESSFEMLIGIQQPQEREFSEPLRAEDPEIVASEENYNMLKQQEYDMPESFNDSYASNFAGYAKEQIIDPNYDFIISAGAMTVAEEAVTELKNFDQVINEQHAEIEKTKQEFKELPKNIQEIAEEAINEQNNEFSKTNIDMQAELNAAKEEIERLKAQNQSLETKVSEIEGKSILSQAKEEIKSGIKSIFKGIKDFAHEKTELVKANTKAFVEQRKTVMQNRENITKDGFTASIEKMKAKVLENEIIINQNLVKQTESRIADLKKLQEKYSPEYKTKPNIFQKRAFEKELKKVSDMRNKIVMELRSDPRFDKLNDRELTDIAAQTCPYPEKIMTRKETEIDKQKAEIFADISQQIANLSAVKKNRENLISAQQEMKHILDTVIIYREQINKERKGNMKEDHQNFKDEAFINETNLDKAKSVDELLKETETKIKDMKKDIDKKKDILRDSEQEI